jgi:hypothetical protein
MTSAPASAEISLAAATAESSLGEDPSTEVREPVRPMSSAAASVLVRGADALSREACGAGAARAAAAAAAFGVDAVSSALANDVGSEDARIAAAEDGRAFAAPETGADAPTAPAPLKGACEAGMNLTCA